MVVSSGPRLRSILGPRMAALPELASLGAELRRDIQVVGAVLPFKVNSYVVGALVDWAAAPDDPIFRLTFPHQARDPALLLRPFFARYDPSAVWLDDLEPAFGDRWSWRG